MKRLSIIFLLLFTCISSTVSAAETTNLALGFNSVTKSLSIVNYTHDELPLSSVTTPAGYTELSPNGGIQVPTASISMVPEQGLTTSTSITWGSASSKSLVGTITVVEWKVNGVVVSAPPTIFAQAGTQTVELRVKNSSGVWSAPLIKSFTVNGAPVAVIGMSPSTNVDNTTAITWTSTGSTISGGLTISSSEWQLDSNPVVTAIPNGIISTVGAHVMKLRVKDSIGSWSAWSSKSFTIVQSNRVPTAVITMTPSSSITDATSITWSYGSSTDPDNDAISSAEWQLDSNPVVTAAPNGIVATVGSHTMKLRVKDARGLWSSLVSQTFSVTASDANLSGYTEVTKPMTSSSSNGFVASTDYSYPGQEGFYAFDGNMSTNWGTGYTAIPAGGHWLKLDLGVAQKVTALKMSPAMVRTGQASIKDWVLYGSNDDVNYSVVTSGLHDNTDTVTTHKFTNGTSYRFYRMNVTTSYDTGNACTAFLELRYYK
jgi:hypothetical protein